MTTKCPMCGLVNFADVDTCRRCGTSFGTVNPAWSSGAAPPPQSWQQPSWPPPEQSSWPPQQQSGTIYDPYAPQGGAYGGGGWQQPAAPPSYANGTVYGTPLAGYASYRMTPELADRGSRLVATIVDNVIAIGICMIPFGIMMAGSQSAVLGGFLLMMLALVVLAVTQLSMLSSRGQTIGKRVAGVRVVKIDTGENGGFVTNVVLRGGITFLCSAVPYIGPIFSLVNILFIFREDQRCIHDHIAGTVVVKA